MNRKAFMLLFDGDLDKGISISSELFCKSLGEKYCDPILIAPSIAKSNTILNRMDVNKIDLSEILDEIDGILALTWFKLYPQIVYMKNRGISIIALGDSDGQVDVKQFPKSTFIRMIAIQKGFVNKLKGIKHWCYLYIKSKFGNGSDKDTEIVNWCDWFTLPNPECTNNLRHILSKTYPDLTKKVKTLYYPVDPAFFKSCLENKIKQIVTVSRFDDEDEAQKNNQLLSNVLCKFLKMNPDYHWVLIGRKANERFSGLSLSDKKITCINYLEKEHISKFLAQSRIMVFTSRWEGSPISANEMLASGGTIVGPNIPGIVGLTKEGRFGSVARRYTSNGLIEAIESECQLWDSGVRDSQAIREFWKDRTSLQAVGNRIALLFGNNA